MSDQATGPGSWQADNGKWYPAEARPDYSPAKYGSATQPGPRWWMAEDGRWYPPKLVPRRRGPVGRRWARLKNWQQVIAVVMVFGLVAGALGLYGYLSNRKTPEEKVYLREVGSWADHEDFALDNGHEVCDLFGRGYTFQMVARHEAANYGPLANTDAAAISFGLFVNAAVADGSLCPEYASRIPAK